MKKLRRYQFRIIAAIIIAMGVLLHIFPVYRIPHIVLNDYYSTEQIAKALYIGSVSDRREAKAVLHLADKAFSDTRHTKAENEEEYGLLSRYATHSTTLIVNDSESTEQLEHYSESFC